MRQGNVKFDFPMENLQVLTHRIYIPYIDRAHQTGLYAILQPMETADLQGTTRRTETRSDEIADDDGKLLSTGSRVQI
jgi:hypothetical protein